MTINRVETAVPASIDGVRNFRDAGGCGGLQPGVLYRSGALHAMSEKGVGELGDLGVRAVVDLRSRPEITDRPDTLHGAAIRYLHVPVFTEQRWPQEQMELYPSMAEHSGRAVLAVIRHLRAEGKGPILVHCASGKDRTGVVVALVQRRPRAAPRPDPATVSRSTWVRSQPQAAVSCRRRAEAEVRSQVRTVCGCSAAMRASRRAASWAAGPGSRS
ncbi:tyrosine-protein phosphatase [Streptomyces argenteolus]|uniref:Tyrosine-protein phosphatase n=1 Tax=Streptomyces argenteolus TaxID=67274 RepID=A0ABW6XGS8_9ACTN